MKKLSLVTALCIAGLGYATASTEKVKIIKEIESIETRVLAQDTTRRNPDSPQVPRTPDRRVPMPSDPTDPQRPIPIPTDPMPSPSPTPLPPVPSPNPMPSPTNPTPPSSPSPTGPR